MTDISNSDDIIDVRDVIARFEELDEEREGLADNVTEATDAAHEPAAGADEQKAMQEAIAALAAWTEENGDELTSLCVLLEECKDNGGDEQWKGDWYPVTLIRDSYFTDYARELCEDIGELPRDLPSYIEIDWERTARNIRMDYTAVEFEGVTYWCR